MIGRYTTGPCAFPEDWRIRGDLGAILNPNGTRDGERPYFPAGSTGMCMYVSATSRAKRSQKMAPLAAVTPAKVCSLGL